MNNDNSLNELDRAVIRIGKSHAALPDLMRALSQGELWTLIPWHPEVEDTDFELTNGMEMPFAQFEDAKGAFVPVFSSFERVREAMKRARFPARTYSAAAVEAKVLMSILGNANLRASINHDCKPASVMIGADMMRDIADGSALQPGKPEPTRRMRMQKLDAADYPTRIVQAAFEVMRQHRSFRAAWIFGRSKSEAQPPEGRGYHMMVLMEPRDPVVFRDLNLVVMSATGKKDELDLAYVPENDVSQLAQMFVKAEPFYVAPDYVPPPAPANDKAGDGAQ